VGSWIQEGVPVAIVCSRGRKYGCCGNWNWYYATYRTIRCAAHIARMADTVYNYTREIATGSYQLGDLSSSFSRILAV